MSIDSSLEIIKENAKAKIMDMLNKDAVKEGRNICVNCYIEPSGAIMGAFRAKDGGVVYRFCGFISEEFPED